MPGFPCEKKRPLRMLRIRASAGSGKTYALTSRFVKFLAQSEIGGKRWQGILAATFTNSAAAEMKDRILRRLKEVALGQRKEFASEDAPLTPDLAAKWLEVILRHLSSLNVSTIDSILCRIVRMGALELGLSPDFEPVFDHRECLGPLWEKLMDDMEDGSDTECLLQNACRELLLHSPRFRGFLAGEMLRVKTLDLAALMLDQGISGLSSAEDLAALARKDAERLRVSAVRLKNFLEKEELVANKNFVKALETCEFFDGKGKAPDSSLLTKNSLDDCLLKDSKGRAGANAVSAYAALREAAELVRGRGKLLALGSQLAPFVQLAKTLKAQTAALMQREGRVLQSLIPGLARYSLEGYAGVSAALCRMGVNIEHILIDEFQDTSRAQWDAIFPLIKEAVSHGIDKFQDTSRAQWDAISPWDEEEDVITIVGDVKQAIYGWRGGDAMLFEEALSDASLQAISGFREDTLPMNRRSRPVIVEHNNQVFEALADKNVAETVLKELLPEKTPENVLGEEAEKLSMAFKDAAQKIDKKKKGGYVRLESIEAKVNADLNEEVRKKLVELVGKITKLRHRSPADIMVLTRSRTQAFNAAQWLIESGFSVVTADSFLLAGHPLIIELVALLTFVNTPDDDIAFCTLLHGMYLCPLDAENFDDWLCLNKVRSGPLWQAFQKDFPSLWEKWFAPFHREAGLIGPYDAVSEALRRFDVFRRFPDADAFARRFQEVIYLAEQRGITGISSFLDYWAQNSNEEKVPMPPTLDSIRIMTMHSAKGLESPIIIAPWLELEGKPGDNPILVERDGLKLLARPCPEMGDRYYEILADGVREALNLLYVTWTRPKTELYAFITKTDRNYKSAKALDKMLEGIRRDSGKPVSCGDVEPQKPVPPSSYVRSAKAEPLDFSERPLNWLPELKIFRTPQNAMQESASQRGSLAHRCLEYLFLSGKPHVDVLSVVRRGIESVPFPVHDRVAAENELLDIVNWVCSLPEASRWLNWGIPEQEIMDASGKLFRADLVVDDGQLVTVVDYKTGKSHPAHRKQIANYKQLLTEAQPLPVEAVLVYLDDRVVERIEE